MGQEVLQAREIKVPGFEEMQSSGQILSLYLRNSNPYNFGEACEKPLEDSNLRDSASIKNTCEELEGCLKNVYCRRILLIPILFFIYMPTL